MMPGPVVRVTEKPPSTFEPGEPPNAILESSTERGHHAAVGQPLNASHHRGREEHRESAVAISHFPSNAEGGFWAFRLTFRVAEPAAWARHLRLCSSANGVTGQGLGEVTNEVRSGAGKPVLAEGQPDCACHDGKRGSSEDLYWLWR